MSKAWDLAVQGMEAAAAHAERDTEGWNKMAYEAFVRYVTTIKHPFMTEDVRCYAEALGMPEPPDKRAWGSVAMRAKRAGLVVSLGYAPQQSANAHKAPKTLWKSAL
jgi:hypothetical protein